jgi:hypothetical protein
MPSSLRREKESQELSIRPVSVRRMGRTDAIRKIEDRRHHVEGDSQMSESRSNTSTATIPAALRPAKLRTGLVLAVIAAMAAFAVRVQAEQMPTLATFSVDAPNSGE